MQRISRTFPLGRLRTPSTRPGTASTASSRARRAAGGGGGCTRNVERAHGIVCGGAVAAADARILVRVGGDVGDKLLGREREEAGKVGRRVVGAVTGRGQAGNSEVVGGDGVGDL